jgi:hypothetical protein
MKTDNPGLYRRLSEPFADADAANEAIQAFFVEVEALREKHRIPDVLVLVEANMMTDGVETRGGARLFRGDKAHALPMLARSYGEERQQHENDMALLIESGRRRKR